jgi:hypothetical protein
MMSDHSAAMASDLDAYSSALPAESLRCASLPQSRQSARWTRNSPLIRYVSVTWNHGALKCVQLIAHGSVPAG